MPQTDNTANAGNRTPPPRERRLRSGAPPWGMVPRWVFRVCAGDLSALAVYAYLATHATPEGVCFPSQRVIAENVGVALRTVERAISKLKAVGLLTTAPRLDEHGRHRKLGNEYTLAVVEPTEPSPVAVPLPLTEPPLAAGPRGTAADGGLLEHTTEQTKQLRVPRKRDPVFDALVAGCGMDYAEMTADARRAAGRAVAAIKEVAPNVSDGEIRDRCDTYRSRFRGATCTPSAVARHWASLRPVPEVREPPEVMPWGEPNGAGR